MDPLALDLATSWRGVVSFTSRLLYPLGMSPRYPPNRGLGGPKFLSGPYGEVGIFYPMVTPTPKPQWFIP
jgi:hypothetical protein